MYGSGNRCETNNHKPVSILPAFSKRYEKIIAARIMNNLEQHTFLSHDQHGVRSNHSTEAAVLQFVNNICNFLIVRFKWLSELLELLI